MKILFSNPVFNEGLNLTTRKGIKWGTVTGVLDVVETGKEDIILGKAEVVDVKVIPFYLITDNILEKEHDPSCREYFGLYNEMMKVYPNFCDYEVVTLIYFNFTK